MMQGPNIYTSEYKLRSSGIANSRVNTNGNGKL